MADIQPILDNVQKMAEISVTNDKRIKNFLNQLDTQADHIRNHSISIQSLLGLGEKVLENKFMITNLDKNLRGDITSLEMRVSV